MFPLYALSEQCVDYIFRALAVYTYIFLHLFTYLWLSGPYEIISFMWERTMALSFSITPTVPRAVIWKLRGGGMNEFTLGHTHLQSGDTRMGIHSSIVQAPSLPSRPIALAGQNPHKEQMRCYIWQGLCKL